MLFLGDGVSVWEDDKVLETTVGMSSHVNGLHAAECPLKNGSEGKF